MMESKSVTSNSTNDYAVESNVVPNRAIIAVPNYASNVESNRASNISDNSNDVPVNVSAIEIPSDDAASPTNPAVAVSLTDLANPPKKKRHRKPRHKKNQPQSIYSVLTASKESVTSEILEKEWITVCRTRRHTYRIELDVLIPQTIAAFEMGMYRLEKNQLTPEQKGNVRKEFAVSRACKYAIKMKLDLIRNDDPDDIRTEPINILALRRGPDEKESVIEQDPTGKKWIEYIIKEFEGTHLKCVKGPCLQLFEKKELVPDSPVICPECKTEQCVFCRAYWKPHDGRTCKTFSKIKYVDPLIIRDLKEGSMQLCPKCDHFSYKESGCNKMICPECKTYWCWACGEYDLHVHFANPYEHFVVDPLEFRGGKNGKQKMCIVGDAYAPARRFVIERNQVGILARLREMGLTK